MTSWAPNAGHLELIQKPQRHSATPHATTIKQNYKNTQFSAKKNEAMRLMFVQS